MSDEWMLILIGFLIGVAVTFQFTQPHLKAALNVLKYAREHGSMDGFDWDTYGK